MRDKGINELMEAFHTLSQKYDQLKLLMVGPYEEALDPISAKASKEIETNAAIISLGWQDDVRPYFAVSDVLIFPVTGKVFPMLCYKPVQWALRAL